MKKRVYFLALAATLLTLSSCSNSDDIPAVTGVDEMTDTPITFQVGVEEAATKAGYESVDDLTGAMGFFMQTANLPESMSAEAKANYTADNLSVTNQAGKWIADGTLLWRNATDEVSWQAYYPYNENVIINDGIMIIEIPADQSNGDVHDFLYGHGTITGETAVNGINVNLEHIMAKLIVNIEIGATLNNAEIDSVVLTGVPKKAELNFSKHPNRLGRFENSLEKGDITMNKVNKTKFEAILIPFNYDNLGVIITLTDKKKFYYNRGTTKLESGGTIYTLNIKIGEDMNNN